MRVIDLRLTRLLLLLSVEVGRQEEHLQPSPLAWTTDVCHDYCGGPSYLPWSLLMRMKRRMRRMVPLPVMMTMLMMMTMMVVMMILTVPCDAHVVCLQRPLLDSLASLEIENGPFSDCSPQLACLPVT